MQARFVQGKNPYKTLDIGLTSTKNILRHVQSIIQSIFQDDSLEFEKSINGMIQGSYELYFNDYREHVLFFNPKGSTINIKGYDDGWHLENPYVGAISSCNIDELEKLKKIMYKLKILIDMST